MIKNPRNDESRNERDCVTNFKGLVELWDWDQEIEEVVKVFEEPGKNNASEDNDPFEVSDVDTMIKYVKENV